MEIGLDEVVKLLRVPEATVSRWVRQGYIPCTYRNGNYLFDPATLKSWARSKQIHLGRPQNEGKVFPQEATDLIAAIELGGAYYQVQGSNKQELFQEVEQLFALPAHPSLSLSDQLMQRENLATTAIGKGIAIPHPRYPMDWGMGGAAVGIFFLETPCEFGAVDQLPVYVMFVLISPSSQVHLQLLSKLAQILRESALNNFIQKHPTLEDLVKQFQKILEKNN